MTFKLFIPFEEIRGYILEYTSRGYRLEYTLANGYQCDEHRNFYKEGLQEALFLTSRLRKEALLGNSEHLTWL